jgi:hypothetical protein
MWSLFKAENYLAEALTVGMVSNKADNFVTCDGAVLRFEAIKYLSKSEVYFA